MADARYEHVGPTSVTLYTVLSTRSGAGAHAGLLINGSERVLFDPAGTWRHPKLPERNDVHFGITPKMVDFYIDYHARETYDVVEQTIDGFARSCGPDHGSVPKRTVRCPRRTAPLQYRAYWKAFPASKACQ